MIHFDYRFVLWPEAPVDAASHFYREIAPEVRDVFHQSGIWRDLPDASDKMDAVAIVFPAADHTHRAWRLAAVQDLACEGAPVRVNGVVGDRDDAISEVVRWLTEAPGVTGQLLAVDGKPTENR